MLGWVLGAALALALALAPGGVHRIEEGHVGIYWFGGALLPFTTDPGYHWAPSIFSHDQVQVTMQTDKVTNIPCGTSGGVMLYFDKIEVVNRLRREFVYDTIKNYTLNYDKTWIYDKIHHEINQFCSVHSLAEIYIEQFDQLDESLMRALQKSLDVWAPGIELIAIRVTKPRIPESIRKNYELIEAERTKLLIASQRQLVAINEADTERKQAVLEAEKALQVAKIGIEKRVALQESKARMQAIDDELHVQKAKATADANFYRAVKEAEGYRALLTKEYLALKYMQAVTENARFLFGSKVPASVFLPKDELAQG